MSETDFIRFVNERENIRVRRASGWPAPWTTDPILQKYRFTNIRRRDDRVSQWLLKEYYPKAPQEDTWLWAMIARLINWPPTLKDIMDRLPLSADTYDPLQLAGAIENYASTGLKVYTGAYMLYAGGQTENNKMKKSTFITQALILPVIPYARQIRKFKTVEIMTTFLADQYGMSEFTAGQVAADLTYLPGQLDRAPDLYTYAPRGPGSQRGLNFLYELPGNQQWQQGPFLDALQILRDRIVTELGYSDMTLHDVQNCLCEFSKYERVRRGQGKPRSIYKPETAY